MPVFEVTIKRAGVHEAEDGDEARQAAIDELTDAWDHGYDFSEIFEIDVKECSEEPGQTDSG